jgi:hypothetical protein
MSTTIRTESGRVIDVFLRGGGTGDKPVALDTRVEGDDSAMVHADLTVEQAAELRDALTAVIESVPKPAFPSVLLCRTNWTDALYVIHEPTLNARNAVEGRFQAITSARVIDCGPGVGAFPGGTFTTLDGTPWEVPA